MPAMKLPGRELVCSLACVVAFTLGAANVAHADLLLGATCKNSNQCGTKRCSENVCKTYRGTTRPYAAGETCRMTAECGSLKCVSGKCGGPTPKSSPTTSRQTGGGGSGPRAPTVQDDGDPAYLPGHEPLPQGKPLTDAQKTPCGQRLVDLGYEKRKPAERICAKYTASQIAKAEEMLKQGYTASLEVLARNQVDFTTAQIECEMRTWDATRSEYVNKQRRFDIGPACRRGPTRAPITASTEAGTQPLLATLRDAKRFTTFLRALEKSGIAKQLAGAGPFTVIAPTDDAFAKLSQDALDAWFADKLQLTERVQFLVLPEEYRITFLDTRVGTHYQTLLKHFKLYIDFDKERFRIGDALGEGELPTTNGVILPVDTVITVKIKK